MDRILVYFLVSLLAATINADIYLHIPRGSNNRLNEDRRERRNANRLFDSQNNNRGGYNTGYTGNTRDGGRMYYYAGSKLQIQWTNQHSCADPNNNCEIIIQYMCSDNLRDGRSTSTIREPRDCRQPRTDYGMHEDYDNYKSCKERERNNGLFTADQQLKGSSAQYTRQNPGGTRRGFECPEERDYYPYWQPSPWKDIVVMANDVSKCSMYQTESQNTKPKWACVRSDTSCSSGRRRRRRNRRRSRSSLTPITKEGCEKIAGARWTMFPAHNTPRPDCRKALWSRDNHNGNGIGGLTNSYEWTVPDIEAKSCALRIRYNISTKDFNSWDTFADKNGKNPTKVDISKLVGLSSAEASSRGYVYKNNPTVQVSSKSSKLQLQLAINTAQYGRTFQDRSHSFEIRKRPAELRDKNIYNLNVRGKRGNIVQVYPAVEYDFVPNKLEAKEGDYVHFQWTGSNRNPNNNDGQGRRGTDRSNVVLLEKQVYSEGRPKPSSVHGHFGRNYPESITTDKILELDDAMKLAILKVPGGTGRELDNASPYFDLGPKKITSTGIYYYMCTRNNNFSNRSQKGKIIVKSARWGKKDEESINATLAAAWIGNLDAKNPNAEHSVRISELSTEEGEKLLDEYEGFMDKDDAYASKYMMVYPMMKFEGGLSDIVMDLKVDKDVNQDDVTVYHSLDFRSWQPIENQDIQDGVARVKVDKGGLYVARVAKDDKTNDLANDEEIEEALKY